MKKMLIVLCCVFGFAGTPKEPILTQEMVWGMLNEAFTFARREGYTASITIVDRSGVVLGILRDYGAGVDTLGTSYKKAYTANSQKKTTKEFNEGIKKGSIPADLKYLDENFTTLDGGIPIVIEDIVVGGIGVSGGRGSEDVKVAQEGIRFLEKYLYLQN